MELLSHYEQQAVVLCDYNPRWPELFEECKTVLAGIFCGENVHIEHIGSTAVAGLSAKPVIDTMLGVESLKLVDERLPLLLELGWFYVQQYEAEMPFRRFFLKCDAGGARSHHLHAVEYGSDFWRRHLLFRDYLRTHPDEARSYGELKRSLLAKKIDRHKVYSEAKGEFIAGLAAKAEQWGKASKG